MSKRERLIAGLLSLVFLGAYVSFYLMTAPLFSSPDENAAYVFAQHFVQTGSLRIDRPAINEVAHPRSTNIYEGDLVPGSFIGLILLLGYAGRLLGNVFMLMLPAMIALSGAWAFYGLVRRIFGASRAWMSLFLLLTLPPWWYYASRGFLPNVMFCSFLLMAAYALAKSREAQAWYWPVVAGLAAGAALAIRPNEITWVIPLLMMAWPFLRGLSVKSISLTMASGALPLLITAYWQAQTFGHWYAVGYQSFASNGGGAGGASTAISLSKALFPFGLNVGQALVRFVSYQVVVIPAILIVVVGGIAAWKKSHPISAEQKRYAIAFAIVSVYLILYYGSWQFSDHPDATRLTLGVSYGRYWLPLYIMAMPFAAIGLQALAARMPRIKSSLVFCFVALFTLNTLTVYAFGDENLGQLERNTVKYEQWQDFVRAQTESNAVIISERNDKVFWPQRQVVHYDSADYAFLADVTDLVTRAPVYLFTAIPREQMAVIEQSQYVPQHLSLQYKGLTSDGMSLYQLIPFTS